MALSAQTLINTAVAAGYDALSERGLRECLLVAAQTGGGGGNAQLVTYTTGTPANPSNTLNPAIAYDPTGNLPTLGWNINTQTWN